MVLIVIPDEATIDQNENHRSLSLMNVGAQ